MYLKREAGALYQTSLPASWSFMSHGKPLSEPKLTPNIWCQLKGSRSGPERGWRVEERALASLIQTPHNPVRHSTIKFHLFKMEDKNLLPGTRKNTTSIKDIKDKSLGRGSTQRGREKVAWFDPGVCMDCHS